MAQPAATKTQKVEPQEPVAEASRREVTDEEIRQRAYEIYLDRVPPLALSWTIGFRLNVSSAQESSLPAVTRCIRSWQVSGRRMARPPYCHRLPAASRRCTDPGS